MSRFNHQFQFSITGIIACGGLSTRMRTDKSLLTYYDQPQRYHLYDQLSTLCGNVFLSLNKSQSELLYSSQAVFDADHYSNFGPAGGLLTIYEKHPSDYYLFIGCDYPALTPGHLKFLIENISEEKDAVCYGEKLFPEPLLAIYSKRLVDKIKKEASNYSSLSYYLRNAKTRYLKKPAELISVDTIDMYETIAKHADKLDQ